jgi:hypothetical protein
MLATIIFFIMTFKYISVKLSIYYLIIMFSDITLRQVIILLQFYIHLFITIHKASFMNHRKSK